MQNNLLSSVVAGLVLFVWEFISWAVLPQGTEMNMGKQMIIGVVTQVVSAFLVLSLMGMAGSLTYWRKVGFFTLAGLAIGFVSHAPYWNWFGFPASYVGVTILDMVVGWTLAGLTVGRLARNQSA